MAYLDMELRNMRLLWSQIGHKIIVLALIVLGMAFASLLVTLLGYGPMILNLR